MVNLLINFNFVTYLWLWSLDPLIVFIDTMVSVALVSGLELNEVEPWQYFTFKLVNIYDFTVFGLIYERILLQN